MYIMPTCLSKCIHLVDLSFLSHFGFYDENEHVVEFQHQPVCAYLCTIHVYALYVLFTLVTQYLHLYIGTNLPFGFHNCMEV